MFEELPWMGVGQRWDGPADTARFTACGDRLRFVEPALPNDVASLPEGFAVLGHSSELPMATAQPLTRHVLEQTAAQVQKLAPPWSGEHFCLNANARPRLLGYNFAPILNEAAIAAAVRNVRQVSLAYGCPVQLEVGPRYFAWEGRWDDHGAILEVSAETGCGIIVDLSHHLCSMNNLGLPGHAGLGRPVLERTVELHLTGMGRHRESGFFHDSHAVPVPDQVWDLLAWVLDRAENLRAVTLEHSAQVSADDYQADLERLLKGVSRAEPYLSRHLEGAA